MEAVQVVMPLTMLAVVALADILAQVVMNKVYQLQTAAAPQVVPA